MTKFSTDNRIITLYPIVSKLFLMWFQYNVIKVVYCAVLIAFYVVNYPEALQINNTNNNALVKLEYFQWNINNTHFSI